MSPRKMLHAPFLLLIVVLISSLLLTACGADEAEEPSGSDVTESEAAESMPTATLESLNSDPEQPAEEAAPEEEVSSEEAQPAAETPAAAEAPADVQDTPEPAAEQNPSASGNGADTGFRPAADGFAYENYGDVGYSPSGETFPITNLTSVEMRRLFGDGVCAAAPKADETCALTPPAKQWMEESNASMNGGHCEGFAALSQLIYSGVIDPNQFGAGRTIDLQVQDNELLQRELAYWFSTQMTIWEQQQVLAPAEAVEYLKAQYASSPRELFRLGIQKADGSGGHAITAYAVQEQGNGVYWIMVYDNNYPGQERHVTVDVNANTWEYEASINPSVAPDLYQGDANNPIILASNQSRLGVFPCPFCESQSSGRGGSLLAQAAPQFNQIWIEGYLNVELEDDQGRLIGYDKDDKFVNQIPEARVQPVFSGPLSEVPPVFQMPVGLGFVAYLYGDAQASAIPASLVMIGKGFYIGIDGLSMEAEQLDTLAFDGEGDFLTYTTDAEETPEIIVGIEKPQADFELALQAVKVSPGTDIHVLFDQKEDTFAFMTTSDAAAEFYISITRIGEDGEEETFDTGETTLTIDPDRLMYFYFGKWSGQGSDLEIGYDENGNGEIEDSEIVSMADAE